MDLLTAKEQAKSRTLDAKEGTLFIELLDNGDCKLTKKQTDKCVYAFKNGAEIPMPKEEAPVKKSAKKKEVKQKTKSNKAMETKGKKSPAKKAAKKTLAKKSNVTRASVKGPEKQMTAKSLRAEVVKGNIVLSKSGKKIPMSKRAAEDPARKFTVKVGKVGGVTAYQLV